MSEEDELLLGTIAGVDLILSPEHYKKYKGTLNKQIEELKSQLRQKENIIKEVREWAKKCSCQFTNDDGELVVSEISFNIQARPCDLFKILDKEVN